MATRTGLILSLIVGAAVLAYQLTSRLSADAINVAVGVLCGIAASLPVALGLLIALTRQRETREDEYEHEADSYAEPPRRQGPAPHAPMSGYGSGYPPVIVVAPPQNQLPNPYAHLLPPGNLPPGSMHEPPISRDFKIIGGDDDTFDV